MFAAWCGVWILSSMSPGRAVTAPAAPVRQTGVPVPSKGSQGIATRRVAPPTARRVKLPGRTRLRVHYPPPLSLLLRRACNPSPSPLSSASVSKDRVSSTRTPCKPALSAPRALAVIRGAYYAAGTLHLPSLAAVLNGSIAFVTGSRFGAGGVGDKIS